MKTPVLVSLASALALATFVPAQALKVERRAYARLSELRTSLLDAVRGADPELRSRVARQVAAASSGSPFEDIAEALALARGVAADDAFLVRAGLMVMALPQVVDPEVIGDLHVTMHAPRVIPDVGPCSFVVRLRDAAGEVVRDAVIDRKTRLEDLLRFRASVPIDLVELPDGAYRVEVDVVMPDGSAVGDPGPRPTDVAHHARIWIQRGYKARADALPLVIDGSAERRKHAAAVAATLDPSRVDRDSQAILTAALWQVVATYTGEARAPSADPIADLERAETILANLQAGRDALAGVAGRMTLGFPIEGDGEVEVGTVSVRVPSTPAHGPLPLVVFVPGAPTWDLRASRPLSPRSYAPEFGWDEIRTPGVMDDGPFLVAVVESPGRYRSASRAVSEALLFLRRTLPVRDDAVFLVGEREGGYVVSRAVLHRPGFARGVVMVTGGGFAPRELDSLAGTAVLAVSAQGHPSTPSFEALSRADRDGVTVLTAAGIPWPVATGVRMGEIAAFVAGSAGVLLEDEETAAGGEERLGFVIAEYGEVDRTRAFALAQWLRREGIEAARVRPAVHRWMVVCYTTAERQVEDRARLAALPGTEFDPDVLVALTDVGDPARLPARARRGGSTAR